MQKVVRSSSLQKKGRKNGRRKNDFLLTKRKFLMLYIVKKIKGTKKVNKNSSYAANVTLICHIDSTYTYPHMYKKICFNDRRRETFRPKLFCRLDLKMGDGKKM